MKKIAFIFVTTLSLISSVFAAPAVVFDWGDVMANGNRSIVVNFLCETFGISAREFEVLNLEKQRALEAGESDIAFWKKIAAKKGVALSASWEKEYKNALKLGVGANPKMLALVQELKNRQVRVGLLSNVSPRHIKIIRDCGYYAPFDPCLLSGELGHEKPSPEAYYALINALQLPPEQIVFFDDKQKNVVAAKKIGIDAILFKSAEHTREELVKRSIL